MSPFVGPGRARDPDRPAGDGRTSVPADVAALLREAPLSPESIEVLETLVEHPSLVHVDALCAHLELPGQHLDRALQALVAAGLVEVHETGRGRVCRYRPADAAGRETVEALLYHYRHNVVEVVKLITQNSIERMHSQAIDRFSDAFLINPDGGDVS